MKLSEAILLGRHTIENPRAIDVEACAIPMALNAIGKSFKMDESESFPERPFYRAVAEEWPWLANNPICCPWCSVQLGGEDLSGTAIIFHPFDKHVMFGEITLEQMCDWIATIEPAEITAQEPHDPDGEEDETESDEQPIGDYENSLNIHGQHGYSR
jgi:hypothetical protein